MLLILLVYISYEIVHRTVVNVEIDTVKKVI